jgi:hypothetical protein
MKKISVPIYKMFFDKNFLNRIEKVNKNHLLTQNSFYILYETRRIFCFNFL